MTETTLTIGQTYDVDSLTLIRWEGGDEHTDSTYSLYDYFADGKYLGPDQHGVYPVVEVADAASPTYTVTIRDDTASDSHDYDSEEEARDAITELCDDWASVGDWGPHGASVEIRWAIEDSDGNEIDYGCRTVEIEPDHTSLIREACWDGYQLAGCGTDPDDHDWTSDGEGGCSQNPGVWLTGGTSMLFRSHCRTCGLIREKSTTGSQRNPGDHDTVSYEMPESDE